MTDLAKYDPLLFKLPKGAITKNTDVHFYVSTTDGVCDVKLWIKEDNAQNYDIVEMKKTQKGFEIGYNFSKNTHYWYKFSFIYENSTFFINKTFDNYSVVSRDFGEDFLQIVTESEYEETEISGGIIYQIMVDRFCKVGDVECREPLIMRNDWGGAISKNTTNPLIINREVFGGNFKGIISKLDYLKQLGVTTIYFNPICKANSNHKYDTANYMKVDEMFGGDEGFKELVSECKKVGINILIDGVYNHTGSDSIYFNREGNFDSLGAFNSQDSKYYNWYSFDNYPNKYKSWWGIDTLPSISHNCEDFQNYIAGDGGVIEKYMKLGISGVRLDVVDEITDEFTKKIAKKVKSFGQNKVVMGEVWEDASTKESYSKRRKYFCDNELCSVMNYPVKEAILKFVKEKNAFELNSTIRMILNSYPKNVQDSLMNFLGTHDTGRILSDINFYTNFNYELSLNLIKIATTIMFTVVGVPSIFYGDERGMENNDGSSRGCIVWESFNTEIFDWYTKLAEIRKEPVFKNGDMKVLYSKHGKFVFERTTNSEKILVLSNVESSQIDINLDGKYKSLLTGEIYNKYYLKENCVDVLKKV